MRGVRRHLAALAAVGLLAGTVTAFDASIAEAADIDEVIGDFEAGADSWTLGLGPEFPGAKGTFVQDAADASSGARSGLLTADFSGGGNYVQISRGLTLEAKALSLDVRSVDLSGVRLRMTDSTGQVHQQRLALTAGADWHELTVTDFDSGVGYVHFGGVNDGVWHGPARSIALIVDKNDVKPADRKAEVRFDAITVTAAPPDIAIRQVVPGNIFVEPDQVEFDLVSRGDSVAWTVRDFWGDEVASGDTAMDTSVSVQVPGVDVGYYTFEAIASLDSTEVGSAETSFALLSEFDAPAPADSPFGIAGHFTWASWMDPTFQLTELAARAGAATVREDATWTSIERAGGGYTFGRFDTFDTTLAGKGMSWLPIAAYTHPSHDNNATPHTDAGRQGYADYAAATVEHFDLPWIEVYNEFNIAFGDRGDGPADSRADYYFPLLKATYETVKASNPDVTVVGGATASVPLAWLEQLFALGGLDYMDAVSVHPYVFPGDPEEAGKMLDDLDALIREYNGGQPKPIWITEQSWPTLDGATGVSESTQAANLVRAHVIAFAHGVEKYFWYDLMNDGLNPTDKEHNYGLLHHTTDPKGRWTPKPAYVSYAAMTRLLSGAEYDHAESLGDGVTSHVFDNAGNPTRVMWSDHPTTVTVETDRPITVTDLTGATEQYTPTAGRVHLSLSDAPIYLTGPVRRVYAQDKYLLEPAAGETAATGAPIELDLVVDNTISPRASIHGTFEIAGTSVPVDVRPGQQRTIPVTLPASDELGPRDLVGQLMVRGKPAARLTTSVDLVRPLALTAAHVLDDAGDDALRVTVTNVSSTDMALGTLSWSIGETTGAAQVPPVLAGGASHHVDLPLTDLAPARYPRELRLTSPDTDDVVSTGTVAVVDTSTIQSLPATTISVDGVLDDLSAVPGVDLLTDGKVQIGDHAGPDDLGGQFWATWDEENFYLSARIDDDVHAQPSAGADVWNGDGFQFGLATGVPGETRAWDELGISLTADGPELYRWLAAEGRPIGLVPDAELAISRDETAKETVYELAIPWTELSPFTPGDRLLSFALILNENDGAGRAGWIEWGSGIARTKDPAQYKPARLDPLP